MTGRARNSRAKTPAERQRDRRARKKRGEVIWHLPFPEEVIRDYLLDEGRLKEWDEDDRRRMNDALVEALLDHFEARVTRDG